MSKVSGAWIKVNLVATRAGVERKGLGMTDPAKEKIKIAENLSRQGRLAEAIELCGEALKLSDDYEIYETRSSINRKLGDIDAAIADLDEVIRRCPEAAAPHFRKGRYFIKSGKHDAAIAAFHLAQELDNGYFGYSILLHRAEAFLRAGRIEDCLRDCRDIPSDYAEPGFCGFRSRSATDIMNAALKDRSG